ncbi:MAG TPA: hypothetical protein VN516_01140, partial [Candidatus Baltobacteraceae bacterium]|nr:hypothetical protein [Candidatus Baltobacteraceae bacterium]
SPNNYYPKETAIRFPSRTPVFYDQTWTDAWPTEIGHPDDNLFGDPDGGLSTGGVGANSFNRLTKARHGSGSTGSKAPKSIPATYTPADLPGLVNMGFADGHADPVLLKKLWDYNWHATWKSTLVVPANLTPN